jgi:hypothetical protein
MLFTHQFLSRRLEVARLGSNVIRLKNVRSARRFHQINIYAMCGRVVCAALDFVLLGARCMFNNATIHRIANFNLHLDRAIRFINTGKA